jgi:hypothetical protein
MLLLLEALLEKRSIFYFSAIPLWSMSALARGETLFADEQVMIRLPRRITNDD